MCFDLDEFKQGTDCPDGFQNAFFFSSSRLADCRNSASQSVMLLKAKDKVHLKHQVSPYLSQSGHVTRPSRHNLRAGRALQWRAHRRTASPRQASARLVGGCRDPRCNRTDSDRGPFYVRRGREKVLTCKEKKKQRGRKRGLANHFIILVSNLYELAFQDYPITPKRSKLLWWVFRIESRSTRWREKENYVVLYTGWRQLNSPALQSCWILRK